MYSINSKSLARFNYWNRNNFNQKYYSNGKISLASNHIRFEDSIFQYLQKLAGFTSYTKKEVFDCEKSGIQISILWLCDGISDCPKGEDEYKENCLRTSTEDSKGNLLKVLAKSRFNIFSGWKLRRIFSWFNKYYILQILKLFKEFLLLKQGSGDNSKTSKFSENISLIQFESRKLRVFTKRWSIRRGGLTNIVNK